jgi:hypothetical protein
MRFFRQGAAPAAPAASSKELHARIKRSGTLLMVLPALVLLFCTRRRHHILHNLSRKSRTNGNPSTFFFKRFGVHVGASLPHPVVITIKEDGPIDLNVAVIPLVACRP